jgi:hypothetical protein
MKRAFSDSVKYKILQANEKQWIFVKNPFRLNDIQGIFPPICCLPILAGLEDATVCTMIITNLPYFPASKKLERK